MKGIIVIGAGGHATVCIDSLRAAGMAADFCVDNDGRRDICNGVCVLHGDDQLRDLRSQGYSRAFVAIGDNILRARLAELALGLGYSLVNAVHPSAIISPSATIGDGAAIMAGAIVNADASVGSLAIINTGAVVEHGCIVERGAHVAALSALAGNVTVGEMSNLGVGVRAIPGVRIGSHVKLGAGAVVIDDIADGLTCVGVPARAVRFRPADAARGGAPPIATGS